MSRAKDREKILSPDKESSLRPSHSALRCAPMRSDALLSYRDSTASEIYMNFVIYELRKIDLALRRVSVGQRLYLA